MNYMTVKHISECYIKPKSEVPESQKPHHLGPFDLMKLSSHYIQKGLLFTKPSQSSNLEPYSSHEFLESLKESLSLTLVHFYPLAGQLATQVNHTTHESLVFVDCNKGPGVKFTHATLNTTISDIITPTDIPSVVNSFFDHHKALCYDGHTTPLLSVQVTELTDGVFIGCSANHAVIDGTSYWGFWNMWSQIHMSNWKRASELGPGPSIQERWSNPIPLPFIHPDEFISCVEPTQLRVRIFHFQSESLKTLKSKANQECNCSKISSFQALSALVWRSIIRSNGVNHDKAINFNLSANDRHRLDPPLPKNYFGNCVSLLRMSTTTDELLNHGIGRVALLINQLIASHNDKEVKDYLKSWVEAPWVPKHGVLYDAESVLLSSSPRFDMYGPEFGLGKAVAVCAGYANRFHGKVTAFPGWEGGGSVDLEICLLPDSMAVLESDVEFMAAVTL